MASIYEMVSLHKYFVWCDKMRVLFRQAIREFYDNPLNEFILKDVKEITFNHIWATDVGLYMSYWYAGLYVVVEGWQELKLYDEKINLLLQSPYVELLKRYRNGVFHFQKDDFDRRFSDLIDIGADTAKWIYDLNNEFGRYFLNYFKKYMKENNILDLDVAIESVKGIEKQKEKSKIIRSFIDILKKIYSYYL